jgi:hypothetical protein
MVKGLMWCGNSPGSGIDAELTGENHITVYATEGLWCSSRLRLFRCPGSSNPLRTAGHASPRCRPSALRRCDLRRIIGQGVEAQPIYGRNQKATRPLTGSLWLKRERPEPRTRPRKDRPRLWPPFFGVAAPSMNPPRKTATDGDGMRGKRIGGRTAPLALVPAVKRESVATQQTGGDSRCLPRKAK